MKVFLSYAHQQRRMAEEVNVALTTRGHAVFFDRFDLKPGLAYDMAIQRNVKACDLFVILLSQDSLTPGAYTLTELGFAKEKWKNPSGRILPVAAGPIVIPTIDAYLRAVTILHPQGNVAAEVAARVDTLLEHRDVETVEVPPTGELQRERIGTYKELWRLTKLLPKWPRSKDVTYEDLGKLSQSLRDWYFSAGGGMFLSRTAHTSYAALQDSLTAILVEQPSGGITDEHYEAVRELCSTLRTRLANDVGSRQ